MTQRKSDRGTAKSGWQQRVAEAEAAVPDELRSQPGIETNLADEQFYNREYPPNGGVADLEDEYTLFLRYEKELKRFAATGARFAKDFERSAEEPPTGERDSDRDVTEAIRAYALDECGFLMAGFAEMQRRYVFQHFRNWVKFPNVVILAAEIDHAAVQQYPSMNALQSELELLEGMLPMIQKLGEYVRSLGYHAQGLDATSGQLYYQPFAVQAGMGQMGANGQVLSPLAGSRMMLGALTTDAPVHFDQPVDIGVPKLCDKCQVCVQRCPGRALTKEKVAWRGVRKFKTLTNRCYPVFLQYEGCSVCMKVCPVQKYGYDAVMDHFKRTGEVLGKGSKELETYTLPSKGQYGPGKLPVFEEGEVILRTLPTFSYRGDH